MPSLKEIFQPRLTSAEKEFSQIVENIVVDLADLPPQLWLKIGDRYLQSFKRIPGKEIPAFAWSDQTNPPELVHSIFDSRPDHQPIIVNVFSRNELPDPCWIVLVLPEIMTDGSIQLSLGLGKLDDGSFFTGWTDSHLNLITKRQTSKADYLGLIQYDYTNSPADQANLQIEANKIMGAAYFFTNKEFVDSQYVAPLPKYKSLFAR